MLLNEIEIKRLRKISDKAFEKILKLNKDADILFYAGDQASRCSANSMYIKADDIYKKEVLFRKF